MKIERKKRKKSDESTMLLSRSPASMYGKIDYKYSIFFQCSFNFCFALIDRIFFIIFFCCCTKRNVVMKWATWLTACVPRTRWWSLILFKEITYTFDLVGAWHFIKYYHSVRRNQIYPEKNMPISPSGSPLECAIPNFDRTRARSNDLPIQ